MPTCDRAAESFYALVAMSYDFKLCGIALRKEAKLGVSSLEICVYDKKDLPLPSTCRWSW